VLRDNLSESVGKGLHPDYAGCWFWKKVLVNVEAIMVDGNYSLDRPHNREPDVVLLSWDNGESYDKPTLQLVDAFPMKDG